MGEHLHEHRAVGERNKVVAMLITHFGTTMNKSFRDHSLYGKMSAEDANIAGWRPAY